MSRRYIRTSEIAKAVSVHPNTVRLYEEWGFLPPIPRTGSGYRKYSEEHLDQMKLARMAMQFAWLSGKIRDAARAIIYQGASGDLGGALESAFQLRVLVESERAQAEGAVDFLELWAQGAIIDRTARKLRIGETAKLLGTTTDRLRNWERNGLIRVPRDPNNSYRLYGAGEIGRLRVIRSLSSARYSQMAILRMLTDLDQGRYLSLRQSLDTPREDEDVYYATDHWLTTLAELLSLSDRIIAHLESRLARQVSSA